MDWVFCFSLGVRPFTEVIVARGVTIDDLDPTVDACVPKLLAMGGVQISWNIRLWCLFLLLRTDDECYFLFPGRYESKLW